MVEQLFSHNKFSVWSSPALGTVFDQPSSGNPSTTMFGPSAPFWGSNLGKYIFEFGSTSTIPVSFMELNSHSDTFSRRPFPYLIPSDILDFSNEISSNQTMNVNTPTSPTISWFSAQNTSQVTNRTTSHPIQTSIIVASS